MLKGGIAASSVLFEKYQVISIVYESDSVTVYNVEHIFMSAKRIIKKILKKSVCRDNFYSEVNILKSIRHPNIPIVYDVEEDNFAYYIIEEYMAGITLDEYIAEHGILSEDEAIDIGIKLCDIISFLHCQKPIPILFLDIHPKNILFDVDNDKIFLVDFGSSYYSNATEKRKFLMGTVGYAAPEQYEQESLDERTDIYGIGAVLHFLVTGEHCAKDDVSSCNFQKNISEQFKMIILRCMAIDRNDRFGSVSILEKNLTKKYIKDNIHVDDEKPHIISFVGVDRRVGVTHVSMAFASYLSRQGYRVLYEEVNESNHARIIAGRGKFKYSNGLFLQGKLMVKPKYGAQINLEVDCDVIIRDCGAYDDNDECIGKICENNSVVMLIAGAKRWELETSVSVCRKVMNRIGVEEISKIHILCNGGSKEDNIAFWRKAGCMGKYIPTLDDVFQCNDMERRFFEELTEITEIDRKGGKIHKKKDWLFRKNAKKAANGHRRYMGST